MIEKVAEIMLDSVKTIAIPALRIIGGLVTSIDVNIATSILERTNLIFKMQQLIE